MASKKRYPYESPVLHDHKGDLSKRWYIEYKVWDISKNKLVRRHYWNLNRAKTQEERYNKAKAVMAKIQHALEVEGRVFNPNAVKKKTNGNPNTSHEVSVYTPFLDAFSKYLEYKKKDWSYNYIAKTKMSYRKLRDFLVYRNLTNITLQKITTTLMDDFVCYLQTVKEQDNGSIHHGLLPVIKASYRHYAKRLPLNVNVINNMEKLKVVESYRELYTDEEAKMIFTYAKLHHPQMYLIINFIYYACIRPKELSLLQIKHIQDDHIQIHGKIQLPNGKWVRQSKNSKTQMIRIFPGLEKVIKEFNLRSYPPDYFVFTFHGQPGINPTSLSSISKFYKPIVEHFDLPENKRLYNWKHTGAVNIYKKTLNIKFVQYHLRHASVRTTERYLAKMTMLDESYKNLDIDILT